MLEALRLLGDVALDRLRKREMANLAASLTIMGALRLGWTDVAVRLGFGLLLNLSVYLTNDWYDIEADLASPHRNHAKARRLQAHRGAAVGAQVALVSAMALIAALWDRGLLVPLLGGAGLCWAYSARLKRVAVADVSTIGICGVAGALVAVPLGSHLGWWLAGQLGLYAACFQVLQMLRDHDTDAAFGARTTAVWLGPARTVWLLRLLLLASALYGVLVIHALVGLLGVPAVALPVDPAKPDRAWNRARLALGLGWLALVAVVWWNGAAAGLLTAGLGR